MRRENRHTAGDTKQESMPKGKEHSTCCLLRRFLVRGALPQIKFNTNHTNFPLNIDFFIGERRELSRALSAIFFVTLHTRLEGASVASRSNECVEVCAGKGRE